MGGKAKSRLVAVAVAAVATFVAGGVAASTEASPLRNVGRLTTPLLGLGDSTPDQSFGSLAVLDSRASLGEETPGYPFDD